MSIDIKYDQNRKVLDVIISGKSDIDEFTSALEKITRSAEYPPDTCAIWDIRNSDLSNVNFQLISEIVKIRSRFTERSNCRSALIVSSNAQYGLSRMFEMLSEGKIPHQFMVFRDYKEGEQWLLKNKLIETGIFSNFN